MTEQNLPCTAGNEKLSAEAELIKTQTKWIRIQTVIISVLLLVVAVALLVLIGKVNLTLDNANRAIDEITALSASLNETLEETKLTELLSNANTLIERGGESLTEALSSVDEALEKVNGIDFDSLNSAINDLQRVVQPLAKLFGK